MSSEIAEIIDSIIEREGGYVDDPNDSGGKTKYGITERIARVSGYAGDMRDLPRDTAFSIYLNKYYLRPNFHGIAKLSVAVAAELTDTEVNLPPGNAAKFLQRALNAFNRQQYDYADLLVDGHIGQKTLDALSAYLNKRGSDGEKVLLCAMNCQQGVYYIERTEARQQNEAFAYGWMRERVMRSAL